MDLLGFGFAGRVGRAGFVGHGCPFARPAGARALDLVAALSLVERVRRMHIVVGQGQTGQLDVALIRPIQGRYRVNESRGPRRSRGPKRRCEAKEGTGGAVLWFSTRLKISPMERHGSGRSGPR